MSQIGIVRAAVNTGVTTTQDFRDPNMTETPNAAIFILTTATTDNTAAATALISIGAATSDTEEWVVQCRSTDGGASTSTRRRTLDTAIIVVADDTNTVIAQASFSSFLSDVGAGAGVQIDVSNAFETAYLLTVIMFAVDDAYAGTYLTGAAATDTTGVTDPAFQPNVVFAGSADVGIPGATNPLLYSLGFAVDGSGQNCFAVREGNGAGTGQPSLRILSTRIAAEVDVSGNEVWSSELTSWDANGFTVTQRTAGGASDEVGYLALDTGALAAWSGTVTSPTSTGNQAITSPSFTPMGVIQLLTTGEAVDTGYTDNRAGSWGIGAFNTTDEYSNTVQIEDLADTTNTQSLSDDVAVNLPDDDGSALCVASFVSMDANGWTLNHTSAAATGKIWIGLAIEEEGAATTTTTTTTTTSTTTSTTTTSTTTTTTTTTSTTSTTSTTTSSTTTLAPIIYAPNLRNAISSSARVELWLTTDTGARIAQLTTGLGFEGSRVDGGMGWFSYRAPASFDDSLFQPDRMLQFWYQPAGGALGLWNVYFLRRIEFETSGSSESIVISGPDMKDLLRRRIVAAYAGSTAAVKTHLIDDMMKEIVTQAIADGVAPTPTAGTRVWSNLSVAGDLGDGPTTTKEFSFDKLMDESGGGLLPALQKDSREKGTEVFFDIVPNVVSGSSITFRFVTATGQPGQDVTSRVLFDQRSGNLKDVRLAYDYSTEENYIYAAGQGEQSDRNVHQRYDATRYNQSIWGRMEGHADARNQGSDAGVQAAGDSKLSEGRPGIRFSAVPVDTAGTRFGIDWDFGYKVRASYRNRLFDTIIRAVSVNVDSNGRISIKTRLDFEALLS